MGKIYIGNENFHPLDLGSGIIKLKKSDGGVVNLEINNAYMINLKENTVLNLPTPVDDRLNQIEVIINDEVPEGETGYSLEFNPSEENFIKLGSIPSLLSEMYEIIFEYNPQKEKWSYGIVNIE